MPRSSGAVQASLRPAAAQAVSEEPDESHAHSGQPAEAEVPIMDSLEQEIERLQRLEQRSAQLQTTQAGNGAYSIRKSHLASLRPQGSSPAHCDARHGPRHPLHAALTCKLHISCGSQVMLSCSCSTDCGNKRQAFHAGSSSSARENTHTHTQAVGNAASRPQKVNPVPQAMQSSSEQGLGISAVSLGIAPDRSSDPPTGSDIALDALAEEEVAHSVRGLLEQHSGPQGRQ